MEEHLFVRGQVGFKDVDSGRLADFLSRGKAGDAVFKERLVDALLVAIRRKDHRYEPPDSFDLPADCRLWQWLEVFFKALQCQDFTTWATQRHLDLGSVRVRQWCLYADVVEGGRTTAGFMTLSDESGWRHVAAPINAVARIIDPAGLDQAGIGARSRADQPAVSLRTALAFYGYSVPTNRPQAQVLVDELQRLSSFPVVDNRGHTATAVLVERAEQIKDATTMVRELERMRQALVGSEQAYDFMEPYRRRVKLDSGSMLAQTMNAASRLLQALSVQLNVEKGLNPSSYYFSSVENALMEFAPFGVSRRVSTHRLTAPQVLVGFRELLAYAHKLGTNIYVDANFTLAALLDLYGREIPGDANAVGELIFSLGHSVPEPAPYVHASAHSVSALLEHRRYIGLLNNRFWMGAKLQALCEGKTDTDPVLTGSLSATLDADSSLMEITAIGREALQAFMALEAFQAIRTHYQLSPDSHVLVTHPDSVGGQGAGGAWVDLSKAVTANTVLADALKPLVLIARRAGGALRSNGEVTLEQALKFYGLRPPLNVKQARDLQLRLQAVPLRPEPTEEYWNALGGTFASGSSPFLPQRLQITEAPEHFLSRIGPLLYYWPSLTPRAVAVVLDASQREQVLAVAVRFMAGKAGSLFEHLAGGVVGDKARDRVRAEADLLLAQMLAGPEAQKLAGALARDVIWNGRAQAQCAMDRACRHALVLATLILGLDPQACASRTQVAGVDLADRRFWGVSPAQVLLGVETSLQTRDGLRANCAVLAAHLLLSGVAPDLLVRDIPAWVSYMTSQTWVNFKHSTVYLEGKYPGSSRRLSFDSLVGESRLRLLKPAHWALKEFSGPVVDWARANGLLPKGDDEFTEAQLTKAKAALVAQNSALHAAVGVFERVPGTRRALALEDLRRVFPQVAGLELRVLARRADDAQAERTPSIQRVSFVDLHLSGQLVSGATGWHSTLDSLNYEEMAKHFHLLGDINQAYGAAYVARENELWSAYKVSLQYVLSLLTLPERQALEYGEVRLFAVSRWAANGATKGCYGILVLCQHPAFSDYVFECFPAHLKIVMRTDLPASGLLESADAPLDPVNLPLDWSAYGEGRMPGPRMTSMVILKQVAHLQPQAHEAFADGNSLSVPATLTSPRITSLVASVIDNSLFAGSMVLRMSAAAPIGLEDAVSGRDPWLDAQRGAKCERPAQM